VGFVKCGEFLDQLGNYKLLKEDCSVHLACLSVSQPVSQSACQSVSLSVSQPVCQSASQSVSIQFAYCCLL
jgi:hypothetical protein